MLCLFAATVFWFFNALNKSYSANISFPVYFEYDQENFIPVKKLPTSVRMNVSGLGWDLLRRSSGLKVPPLIVPLEKPSNVHKIVGSTLPSIFASQLGGLQINFVLTDTVHIDMEQKIRRRVKLSIDSVNQYVDKDFGVVSAVNILPDTVWLEGPTRMIKSLPEILKVKLPYSDVDQDFDNDIELVLEHGDLIERNPPVVRISFEVEKFTEVQDKIELKIINVSPRYKPSIDMVKEIQCTYRLPLSLARRFSGDSLLAVVDLLNVNRGNHKIVPRVQGLPAKAQLLKADTVRVNF